MVTNKRTKRYEEKKEYTVKIIIKVKDSPCLLTSNYLISTVPFLQMSTKV